MKKKVLAVLLTAAMTVTCLAGCGSSTFQSADVVEATEAGTGEAASATAVASGSDTLTIGLNQEPISLDSAFAYDFTTNPVVNQITESLLYYGENDAIENGLCESWEEVDGLTYVYNVRSDVTFSDGTPMTMEDVMFSIERYQDPAVASYLAWMYANVESIEQTGDWQFTVHLSQADALWKHTFATTAGQIHSKAYVEAHPDDYGTPEGGVLGTGPYVFDSWDVGNQIVLTANENYWNKDVTPQIKTVVFKIVTEDTTRVMASTSNQMDINLFTPVEMLDNVKENADVTLQSIPSWGLRFISFNCKKAPFDDANVRRAISYALDDTSLQTELIKEYGEGTTSNGIPVPESLFLFDKEDWTAYQTDNCPPYTFDVDKAKEALAASAYPDGFDCELTIDERSIDNSLGLYIQQSLAAIGINVTINKVSNDELVSLQFGSGIDADGVRPYDFALFEWSADFPDPSGNLTPLYASSNTGDGGSNSCAYENPELDELLLQQAASTDDVERTQLMLQAIDIINADVPNYVYMHQNWLFTVNNRVTGGVADLTGAWFWNFYVKNVTVSE
ncbi:MAG: ABC transporter substrate-binding protein [Lachnospiraceae bacterium]|nr:ABC transporter substrate-binding protein [Lachnospiraceae bacterium]